MSSGRKREFDENTALNAAMEIFWQKGYVGTSLSDLTKSMGINKPSLYSAFGNKESLFIKATQLYIDTQMKPCIELLFEPGISLKQRLKNHMMSAVKSQCAEGNKGCYLVFCRSEMVSGSIPELAEDILKEADVTPNQLYADLFTTDLEAIELGLNKNADSNALSIYTMLKGTASMARSGCDESKLEYTINSILTGIGIH